MLAIKTIMQPNDFSPLGEQALHLAHALARDYKARLILLHVRSPQETVEGEFGMLPPEPEEPDEAVMERLEALIPEDSPVEVEVVLARGDPADEIVQAAREFHCDLIVLGTHGHSGWARFLKGSVGDKVVRLAPCPVLTVRSAPTELPGSADQPTPETR